MFRLCIGIGFVWAVAGTTAVLIFLCGSMLLGNPYFQNPSVSLRFWIEFGAANLFFGYAWGLSLLRFWPKFVAEERIRFFYRASIFLSAAAGLMLGVLAGKAMNALLMSSLFFTIYGGVTGAWISGTCIQKIRLDPHLAERFPVPEALSVLITFAVTSGFIWACCSPLFVMILLCSKVVEGYLSISDVYHQLLYAIGFSYLCGVVYGFVAFMAYTIERSSRIRNVPLAERIKRMGFFLGLATSARHVSIIISVISWFFVGTYLNRYVLEPAFHAGAVVGLGSAVLPGLPAASGPFIADLLVTKSLLFRRLVAKFGGR